MTKKGDKIIMPFLGRDKISINKAKEFAKKEYPNAKKYIYEKPRFIEYKLKSEFRSFWTDPNIEIIF